MKQILLKTWLTMICLLFGVGMMWAENVSLDLAGSSKWTNNTITKDGVTMTITSGSLATNASQTRLGEGAAFTITAPSGKKVTSANITTNSTNAYVAPLASTTSTYTGCECTVSGTSATITVNSGYKSIICTNLGGAIRITQCVVTIEDDNSGTDPEPAAYTVTVANNIANGTVSASPTSAAAGATITLTATPSTGYEFDSWNVTNASTSAAITVTNNKFTMPAANVNVSATFNAVQGGGEEPSGDENTGTITFGTNKVKIDKASVNGNDDLGNSWTITTAGTSSFTANTDYYQVGSSKSPATSITFTTTLPEEVNVTSMSAKFGGFASTAGTVTLKVGERIIGTGSLNETNDVTVSSTSTAKGKVLTVTLTNIAKGVKVYNLSYTYTTEGGDTPEPEKITPSLSFASTTATAYLDALNLFVAPELTTDPQTLTGVAYSMTGDNVGTINSSTGALTLTAAGTATITASYAGDGVNYKAAEDATYTLTVNETVPEKSIAEFIASEGGICYLTGVVSNIAANNYGNFDLTDETGTIYVYGCLTPEGQKQQFNTLGVVVGDKIKVLANEYTVFNETKEAVNVIFVEEIEIEKTKYTVTIEAPANGTLVVKEGENVLTSGAQVEEGKTLTIECTPDKDYTLKNWQYKEDGNWITMDNTMTRVVTQNISIRANFEPIPTYTVAFSVNGKTVQSDVLKEGAAVTAYADPEAINGKVFTGWIETATVEGETPAYVTPAATATKNVTYYAVFAEANGEGGASLTKLNGGSTLAEGDDIVVVAQSGGKYYVMYQETVSTSYVNYHALDHEPLLADVQNDNKMSWTLTASENSTWILGDATNGYLQNSSNNLYANTEAFTPVTIAWNNTESKYTIKNGDRWIACRADLTGDNQYKFRGAGTQSTPTTNSVAYLDIYRISASTINYSDFTTTPYKVLVLNDTDTSIAKVEDTFDKVTVNRTLKAGVWNTFCVPFDMEIPDGWIVKELADEFEVSQKGYNMRFSTAESIESHTPYMVRVASQVEQIVVENTYVLVNDEMDASAESYGMDDDTFYTLTFHGNFVEMNAPVESYFIKNNVFYTVANDGDVLLKGFRGYITIESESDAAESKARALTFSFDDIITGIEGVTVEGLDEAPVIYNLQGQRVNRTQKGVYVVNGRKVIR